MVNSTIIIVGISLLIIAVSIYVMPINDVTTEGYPITVTVPLAVGICNSDMGQLGQVYNFEVAKSCSMYNLMSLGMYGSGIAGIALIIVGAIKKSK